MSSQLLKICGVGAMLICLTAVDAQAGGRRRCHSQPYYTTVAPVVSQPMAAATNANGRVQYQSAYQAPAAPAASYYAPTNRYRDTSNRWDAQQHFARHIKGLE